MRAKPREPRHGAVAPAHRTADKFIPQEPSRGFARMARSCSCPTPRGILHGC